MRRVGDILLDHGWVDATNLERAIAEQAHAGKRLCSMLITRGLLDPDHAARALGEQHGVASVLQKHLEHRERELSRLLPPSLARAWLALPIGRLRDGELIVCVRDPRPELHAALVHAIRGPVVLAVAPAHQLEALIDQSYEAASVAGFDVDVDSEPIDAVDVDLSTGPIAVIGESLPGLDRLAVVRLDDSRVAKDLSQSPNTRARAPITLPPAVRAGASLPPANRPPSSLPPATTSRPPSSSLPPATARAGSQSSPPAIRPPATVPPLTRPPAVALGETLNSLSTATERDLATDLAMRFAEARWTSALLLTIRDGAALGHRGHGAMLPVDSVHAIALPVGAPSLVQLAHDTRRLASAPSFGDGPIHDRLHRLLGGPLTPAAAPVLVGPHVVCVLAVGDPYDPDPAHAHDLEQLVAALGAAFTRLVKDKKA